MGTNKIIGSKIKAIRDSKQLTLDEVAERAGLSVEQIERIESDMDFPSLAPLIKIARVLGVRLGTFLDDQSELGPVIYRKKIVVKKTRSVSVIILLLCVSIWNIMPYHRINPAVIWNLS